MAAGASAMNGSIVEDCVQGTGKKCPELITNTTPAQVYNTSGNP